jgi:hypothetical protein
MRECPFVVNDYTSYAQRFYGTYTSFLCPHCLSREEVRSIQFFLYFQQALFFAPPVYLMHQGKNHLEYFRYCSDSFHCWQRDIFSNRACFFFHIDHARLVKSIFHIPGFFIKLKRGTTRVGISKKCPKYRLSKIVSAGFSVNG